MGPFGRLTAAKWSANMADLRTEVFLHGARQNAERAGAGMADLPALDKQPDRREPSEGSERVSVGPFGRLTGHAWPTYLGFPRFR